MHPMFVTLFIETGADDWPTEEQDRKRRARGQARQISPGHEGCRRQPESPATPLRHEPPTPVARCRWPAIAEYHNGSRSLFRRYVSISTVRSAPRDFLPNGPWCT